MPRRRNGATGSQMQKLLAASAQPKNRRESGTRNSVQLQSPPRPPPPPDGVSLALSYLSGEAAAAAAAAVRGSRRVAFALLRVCSKRRRRRPTSFARRMCVSRSAGCISAALSRAPPSRSGVAAHNKTGEGQEEAGLQEPESRAREEALLLLPGKGRTLLHTPNRPSPVLSWRRHTGSETAPDLVYLLDYSSRYCC